MAAASGSSMPRAFLKLIIVSASSPLSSSFPGGRAEDTNLNDKLIENITKKVKHNSWITQFRILYQNHIIAHLKFK